MAGSRGEGRGAAETGGGLPLGVGGVEVRSAAFAWSKEGEAPRLRRSPSPCLRCGSHPGSLVVVVGPVGSGKSSLLAALLGEMHSFPLHEEEAGAAGDGGGGNLDRGESSATPATPLVSVRGTVAFCSQEPWIQNATVRENVTFGLPSTENDDGDEEEEEDEATADSVVGNGSSGSSSKESPPPPSSRRRFRRQWYERCLDACALRPDLAELPAKDLQEIGERGVNLSGGQRARVALARACYADADVYLLDDPLSAVDAHVGASLWSDCLNGILKNKTRVLATHHAHYAAAADAVVVMKGGKVEAFGRPEELAARGVDFGEMEKLLVGEAGAGYASSLPPSPRAIQPQTPSPQKGAATAPAAAAPSAAAFLPSAPESDGGGGGEQRQQLQQRQQAAAAAAAAATATAVESPRGASLPSSTLPPWSTVAQDAAAQEEKEKELKRKKALEVEGGEEETTALIPAATAAPSSPSSGAARGSALGPASSSRIVRAEGRAVGKVSRAVYATYLSAWGSVLGGGAGGGGVGARFGEEEEGQEREEGGAAGGGGGGGAGPGASPSAPPPQQQQPPPRASPPPSRSRSSSSPSPRSSARSRSGRTCGSPPGRTGPRAAARRRRPRPSARSRRSASRRSRCRPRAPRRPCWARSAPPRPCTRGCCAASSGSRWPSSTRSRRGASPTGSAGTSRRWTRPWATSCSRR